MNLVRGGIVSFAGGGGGSSTVSGIRSLNGETGPDITINGVSGITVLTVAPNVINVGLTTPYSGIIGGSGIRVEQLGGNFVISVSGITSSSSTVSKFSQTFSNITSGIFAHNLGTLEVIVQVYDATTGGARAILPDEIVVENLNQVSLTFNRPQSGRVVIV